MRYTGASQGDMIQRIEMLERMVSALQSQLKTRWNERTPKFLLQPGSKIWHGVTEEAIAKDAVGDVEIHDSSGATGTVVEVTNKLGDIESTKDCYFTIPVGYTARHLLSGEC
jgi:hypothetical protein